MGCWAILKPGDAKHETYLYSPISLWRPIAHLADRFGGAVPAQQWVPSAASQHHLHLHHPLHGLQSAVRLCRADFHGATGLLCAGRVCLRAAHGQGRVVILGGGTCGAIDLRGGGTADRHSAASPSQPLLGDGHFVFRPGVCRRRESLDRAYRWYCRDDGSEPEFRWPYRQSCRVVLRRVAADGCRPGHAEFPRKHPHRSSADLASR
ncbi:hypothetical protein FQZ97_594770 [compost metagenome]